MLLEGNMDMASWTAGCKPTRYPGIYKTKTGYRVRVRAIDPRTGTLKEANRDIEGITLEQALVMQAEERERDPGGRRRGGAATSEVRRLRDILVRAKDRDQGAEVGEDS